MSLDPELVKTIQNIIAVQEKKLKEKIARDKNWDIQSMSSSSSKNKVSTNNSSSSSSDSEKRGRGRPRKKQQKLQVKLSSNGTDNGYNNYDETESEGRSLAMLLD